MKVLVIKNGLCDTDIDRIIKDINYSIEVDIFTSIDVIDKLKTKKIKIDVYKGVILMGGHQTLTKRKEKNYEHPYLNDLIDYIKVWLNNGIYLLGICLGAQMIGEAIGFTTVKMKNPIKMYNQKVVWVKSNGDKLLKNNFEDMIKYVLCYHYDRIDLESNPNESNLSIIACNYNNDECTTSQIVPYIFKINNAYGVQFHPEITDRILKQIALTFGLDQSVIDFSKSNRDMIDKATKTFFDNWIKIIS
jgi:GMP synthase-like glutamine amidotransferase